MFQSRTLKKNLGMSVILIIRKSSKMSYKENDFKNVCFLVNMYVILIFSRSSSHHRNYWIRLTHHFNLQTKFSSKSKFSAIISFPRLSVSHLPTASPQKVWPLQAYASYNNHNYQWQTHKILEVGTKVVICFYWGKRLTGVMLIPCYMRHYTLVRPCVRKKIIKYQALFWFPFL